MDLSEAVQPARRPLSIWAVSDGRAGIEAQTLALAEAVARAQPAGIVVKRVAWRAGLGRLPTALMMALPRAATAADLAAPWPDIWIAAGRAALPLSVHMRRWSPGTFVVQAQDPRWPPAAFDLVIPPVHDGLSGPNVFPIIGAPSRMTAERLAEGRARFAAPLAPLPRPHIAVAVGGASAAYDLPRDQAAILALAVLQTAQATGGSILLTFSRRTPQAAKAAMTEALAGAVLEGRAWIWDGEGENPYAAFLGSADHVLVTEDSVNMALDAAATNAPVQILPLRPRSDRAAAKFRALHADLQASGRVRPFGGGLERWPVEPILEADRAAAEILRRFDAKAGDLKVGLDPATGSRQRTS
ncbi:mitochondrial fission ELM1 family protein [Phenylobacterium immobile]|uniref:mitochondrial fission ELM1 family protein n=1 Tax=Phenylobacterium immobile TaxID=21 RepID=UPI000B1A4B3A|nr:mitochondrial fission ELM1 family protein [Phenylobacterium immobile]